ncbi:hypothetical protein [Piscinibacter koreensis]|uniref:Uncharacterized protein n=1 Tax=Piscinibacter koreensis TaxID=2742824 RepID=A0A7Y6NKD9_9BURK|nr:hypothetical protein [Schlegelella koreensis]NUZ04801.1 hypothetical protein [Schlegelella koreensis]
MNPDVERRAQERDPEDELSPECLALLVTCGGEIRESDQRSVARVRDVAMPDRRRGDRRATAPVYVPESAAAAPPEATPYGRRATDRR